MDVVYHVTFASKVPAILRGGLRPLQTSNWVRSGDRRRYGAGQIFVFEHWLDAVRWAAKMDWAFHHETGSGKVVILRIARDAHAWEEDDADFVSRAGSRGRWLKRYAPVPPAAIVDVTTVTTETIRALMR